MKDDKRVDINKIYNDLYQYCFDILVDTNGSWNGSIGLDEKTIRARYAYIKGVSDTIRELDGMLSCYNEEDEEDEDDEDNEDDWCSSRASHS